MRISLAGVVLVPGLFAILIAVPHYGYAAPLDIVLKMEDELLPIEEIRPQDRRVYVVTLSGEWSKVPERSWYHYINVFLPDGTSYSHKVIDGYREFERGQIRAMLQEYPLRCSGALPKGSVRIAVSRHRPAASLKSPDLVSEAVSLSFPLERPIVRPPEPWFRADEGFAGPSSLPPPTEPPPAAPEKRVPPKIP